METYWIITSASRLIAKQTRVISENWAPIVGHTIRTPLLSTLIPNITIMVD